METLFLLCGKIAIEKFMQKYQYLCVKSINAFERASQPQETNITITVFAIQIQSGIITILKCFETYFFQIQAFINL